MPSFHLSPLGVSVTEASYFTVSVAVSVEEFSAGPANPKEANHQELKNKNILN